VHKYNAQVTYVDGRRFDSKAEAHRYGELQLLEKDGQIHSLICQPSFVLQSSFVDNTGKKQSAIKYVGDFQYKDTRTGKWTVEDVKGMETPVFRLKRKMFLKKYPEFELRIIK